MDAPARLSSRARTLERVNTDLERSELRLRRVLQQLPAVIWAVDRELMLQRVTGGRIETLGPAEERAAATDLASLLGERESAAEVLAAHERALNGESAAFEVQLGGRTWSMSIEPVRCQNTIEAFSAVTSDSTASSDLHSSAEHPTRRPQRGHQERRDRLSLAKTDPRATARSPAIGCQT